MSEAASLLGLPGPDSSRTWTVLARHQLGAFAATMLDFATMILLVEALGASPVTGTAVGASIGGVANFALSRAWVFPGHRGHWSGQALRYALASATGAGLNALGEHVVNGLAHVPYVLARVLVSVAVSLVWSFPVQRYVVFRDAGGEPSRSRTRALQM